MANPSTKPPKPKNVYYTYWMTRDSADGVLSPMVDVWLTRPTRERVGQIVRWLGENGESDRWGRWTIGQCLSGPRVYPDDDRQSIVVGDENSVKAVVDAAKPKPGAS